MPRRAKCKFKHTPIAPAKNDIRCHMLAALKGDKDLITISHACFDMVRAFQAFTGWSGRILACDTDVVVQDTIWAATELYPSLNILPPGGDILSTVQWYLERFGATELGVVDMDLAFTLKTNGSDSRCPSAWKILKPVLQELLAHGFRGSVYLTFVRSRDRHFKSDGARIAWLKRRLPSRVELTEYTLYQSHRIDDWARYSPGSAMGIAELKVLGRRHAKRAA